MLMEDVKALSAKRAVAIEVAKFAALLGAALTAPLIGQQAITGTIVNCTLFLAAALLGRRGAVLIALVPSIFALATGLLPLILAPMIPAIMIGNVILIMVFDFFRKKNYWLGMASASFLKFIFLAGVSSVVIDLFLKKEVASQVAAILSWPQLLTALAGGVAAYLLLKGANKLRKQEIK